MNMRRVRPRTTATAVALALALSVVTAGHMSAAAARQSVPINWHAQTGLSGPVSSGAVATLVRRAGGVSFRFQTENLRAGHAYTIWFVAINKPDACSVSPCPGPEVILNDEVNAQVTYGAGHVVGASGRETFAGSIRAGELANSWFPGRDGLLDPLTAEVHLTLNDHGPLIPGFLPGMIRTYRAACTDESLPAIFPATAKADGAAGPNTCQLYQVAAFVPG
jgi:hypothetical protein